MNKEIKKAAAVLEEKEKTRAAAIAKAENELKETSATLTALNEKLNAAQDAAEYKTLLAEIRDNEAVLSFCEKKAKEAKAQALTPAEYGEIKTTIKQSYDAIQAEQSKAIRAAIENFEKVMNTYDAEIAELNKMLFRAAQLVNTTPSPYNVLLNADLEAEQRIYMETYFRVKNARQMLNRSATPKKTK